MRKTESEPLTFDGLPELPENWRWAIGSDPDAPPMADTLRLNLEARFLRRWRPMTGFKYLPAQMDAIAEAMPGVPVRQKLIVAMATTILQSRALTYVDPFSRNPWAKKFETPAGG